MQSNQSQNPAALLSASEPLLNRDQVRHSLDQWAVNISIALAPRLQGQTLTAIAIMRGGLIPAAWLLERLHLPVHLDYAHATRYRSGTEGHELEWQHKPALDIKDRPVLIIDDIFDHGYTMQAMRDWCVDQGAAQVWTAALVLKRHEQGLPRDWLDFAGLEVPDEYVFGCGMDIYEHWRHLPEIRVYRLQDNDNE